MNRSTANQDEDLEELQRRFFEANEVPSVSVLRSMPPKMNTQKKQSLFAKRRAQEKPKEIKDMPVLEPQSNEPPPLEPMQYSPQSTPSLEPAVDPFKEPHKPATKKMLDLSSMLGNVMGQVKEHIVDKVEPPSIDNLSNTSSIQSGRHVQGFPEPVHRLENQNTTSHTVSSIHQDESISSSSEYHDENMKRIQNMSMQEIEDARSEIFSTLSSEAVARLMNRQKNKSRAENPVKKKTVTLKDIPQNEVNDDDLFTMKTKYFADVPLEREKLAWIDGRFAAADKEEKEPNPEANQLYGTVYRKVRFDLQGNPINPEDDIPHHKGLHHHGDDPDKAGYTLAELFYLVRSQVPSQRAMVLNIITRILWQTKAHIRRKDNNTQWWQQVLDTFLQHNVAAPIYLRSALDDRSLAVLSSAIEAMAALVLDDKSLEDSVLDTSAFNQYLGHVFLYRKTESRKKKGLNEKFSTAIDQMQQSPAEEGEESDAMLAERNLLNGLLRMEILPRIRYLMDADGDLRRSDRASMEWLVRILVRFAESGPGACEAIAKQGLLDVVVDWGLNNTTWPMTDEEEGPRGYPSLVTVRLLTVLAQGKKSIAKDIVQIANVTLQFLVVSPEIACITHQRRATALQLETLKLMRVLVCHGLVMPTLEDLQEPVTGWLRSALKSQDAAVSARAAAALCLLEVLLHAAADPHRTVPAHAVEWPQATAAFPLVTVLLQARPNPTVYDCALGYLATWVSHVDKFRPSEDDVREAWNAAKDTTSETSNGVLRYVQFLAAFASIKLPEYEIIRRDAQSRLASQEVARCIKQVYKEDMLGRLAFRNWIVQVQDRTLRVHCWGDHYDDAELEAAVSSAHGGAAETWLAQALVQDCVLDRLGGLAAILRPFYLSDRDIMASKALFDHDGRTLETLMFPAESHI